MLRDCLSPTCIKRLDIYSNNKAEYKESLCSENFDLKNIHAGLNIF